MVEVEVFETMRFVRVEVPAASVPPIVVLPALSTAKDVVEAELTTSNARTPLVVFAPQTESLLYGVVVPMPTLPPLATRILSRLFVKKPTGLLVKAPM